MNHGVNMPDWHQYNSPQTVRAPSSALSSTSTSTSSSSSSGQNANVRVYTGGAGSPALDGVNLSNDRHRANTKHQTEAYVSCRNYPIVGGVQTSGNLSSRVTAHYGIASVRNPTMEGITPLGIQPMTDEAPRSGQMGYGPSSSANQPSGVVNAATAIGPMGSQGSSLGSASPGRPGINGALSYVPCKAPCCNPDPGIYHQHWDKFARYPSATVYRDTVRQSSVYPAPMDARLFLTKPHKDCHEKEIVDSISYHGDHRVTGSSFTDYNKYARKDSLARNYTSSGNVIPHHNYPMANYQLSADYQKCPYTGKDYTRRGSNQSSVLPSTVVTAKNPTVLKYHEQQSVIHQKYQHSKQMHYHNGPGASNSSVLTAPPRSNANTPALQNSYFNTSRDYSQDYSSQEQSMAANRTAQSATGSQHVHGSFPKYHVYHQKIAMQRYSLENHMRAFSRMPGYQNHPKYQECVIRYRELLRHQQTVDCQSIVQESSKVSSPTSGLSTIRNEIHPINLQFDKNGVLVNSSYVASSGAYGAAITAAVANSRPLEINDRETRDEHAIAGNNVIFENSRSFDSNEVAHGNNRILDRPDNAAMKIIDNASNDNSRGYYPNENKDRAYEVRTSEIIESRSFVDGVSENSDISGSPRANATITEYVNSKDFADKPELDVRQFLANWDESEDEESTVTISASLDEANERSVEVTSAANEESPEKPEIPAIGESSSLYPSSANETIEIVKIDDTLGTSNIRDNARSNDEIDDIPTIRIVENIANDREMEKIHAVFGKLATAILEPISIRENSEIEDNANGETIVLLERQETRPKSQEFDSSCKIDNSEIVEGAMASILVSVPTDEPDGPNEETSTDEDRPEVESAPDAHEEQTRTDTSGDATSNASSSRDVKCNDTPEINGLRKQSSFTSDETHNPDDISLPDLQTSSCTPISTTLNTPIHSDSEESTEHVSDLTISTNPIEIIQNSPIISFAHSPIKIEPYEQIDRSIIVTNDPASAEHATLDFDFDEEVASNENRKYNETCDSSPESVVEELENEARGNAIYVKLSVNESNVSTRDERDAEKTNYYRDPLVGMATHGSNGDNSQNLDVARVVRDDGNATTVTPENVFNRTEDLEKLCDMSLDDDIVPLIPDDVACNDEPRMPVSPMEENCLTDILNDTLPITDLDILETSGNENIDKTNGEDDLWGQVRTIDKHYDRESEAKKFAAKATKSIVSTDKTSDRETGDFTNTPGNETGESDKNEKIDEASEYTRKTTNQPESSDSRDYENVTINDTSKQRHVDSNVEIQVAKLNVKIHNDTEKLINGDGKMNSIVEGVDAIEIKINLSRGDVVRTINGEGKFNAPMDGDGERKRRKNGSVSSERIRHRRRRSMPESFEDFESKRTRREENCSARWITKHRRNRKIRRSMDDELLLEAHSTRESSISSSAETNNRDFHVTQDSRCLTNVNDRQWDKTTKSTRNRINNRAEKFVDSRRLPCPSYNSSIDNSSTLDFDNFDVAPNRDSDADISRLESEARWAREKFRTYGRRENSTNRTCGRFDDISSVNALERNLNTVPIYTTKDGRITYSPNSNYTYGALIIEARQRAKRSPALRKAHARSRNSHREATSRKNHLKTSGGKAEATKSRDYTLTRKTSKLRSDFYDGANDRPEVRSTKYENRRNASAESTNRRNVNRAKESTRKPRNRHEKSVKRHDDNREPEVPVSDSRPISEDRPDAKIAESPKGSRSDETAISFRCPNNISIDEPVVENIFQGHEFEVSRGANDPVGDKIESSEATLRFFRDNSVAPGPTIMASPSTRPVDKRPQIWDLECQTAMSDSGLESSTTYVEASKESRKIQKWKNTFVDRVERAKSLFSVARYAKNEASHVTSEIAEEARQNHEAKSYGTSEKDEAAEAKYDKIAVPTLPPEKIIPEKFHVLGIDDSEIVERLDLAVAPCDLDEATKKRGKKKERDKRAAKIFDDASKLSFRRCVSNDGGEFTGLSFEIPKRTTNYAATTFERKISEEIHESASTEIFQSCRDCTLDNCASFTTSSKLPEGSRVSSTMITVPQLEDTSTRFASESMDFNDVYARMDDNSAFSSRGTFLPSRLDENAIDPCVDCSRRSSDSGHSKDSRKAPILSFSGQIQSDSSLVDAASKSPPDITRVNEAVEKSSIDEHSGVLDEKIRINDCASHPKIPKMIIRNIRSRPGTPSTVEEFEKLEETSPLPDAEKKPAASPNETKIPKMKIKLDDNQLPRMIVDNSKSSRPDDKKNKIKRASKCSISRSPSANEKLPLLGKLSRQSPEKEARDSHESAENSSGSYKFTLMEKSARSHNRRNRSRSREKTTSRNHHHHHRNRSRSREKLSDEAKHEKIPKLTIKKQTSQTSSTKKPRSDSPVEIWPKKRKCTSDKPFTKSDESRAHDKRRTSLDSNESNNDSSLSEKVPKVIIKRASPSAEFKCELSKSDRDAIIRDSKWQPEVKLRRFWVLDCMAKEPGNGQVALKVLESTLNQGDKDIINEATRKNRYNRSSSDAMDIREKTYEGKVRRRSDCDLAETNFPTCNKRRKSFESENIEFTDHRTKEHFSFTPMAYEAAKQPRKSDKSGDKATEKTGGKGSLKKSLNTDENNAVIKLDSSDESQTTIELLPASLENSQLDTNNQYFTANGAMGKLYSDDAIPTQFELELEIVDNSTVDSLDVPVGASSARESYEDEGAATDLGSDKYSRPERKKTSNVNGAESIVAGMRNVCCSDSLVKEVLAAKETLKRCLMTKSRSLVARRTKPRPKTAAEKKQGSYDYVVSEDSANDRNTVNGQIRGFQDNGEESSREKLPGQREDRVCPGLPFASAEARKETRKEKTSRRFSEAHGNGRARSSDVSTVARSLKRSSSSTSRDATNKTTKSDDVIFGENSRTKGIASVRKKSANSMEKTDKEETRTSKKTETCDEVDNNLKSYKIPKISRSKDPNGGSCGTSSSSSSSNGTNGAVNDDKRKSPSPAKMPILEPETVLNFELAQQRDSDRDASRSPPVITKQEESLITVLTPKKIEDNVDLEKLDGIEKQRDNEAVTFADIVSQLAYHEKATIRHRRYCTLCERWFPTAARHRRHLTGYQHRHTELTQRRTVHALFMLFTGKPCPRLLPASIVRTDCLPGEPTPLQIAVQDVAISLENGARAKPSKDASDKDE